MEMRVRQAPASTPPSSWSQGRTLWLTSSPGPSPGVLWERGWLQWAVKPGWKFLGWKPPLTAPPEDAALAAPHTRRGRKWLWFGLWLEIGEVRLTAGLRLQAVGSWSVSLQEMGKVTVGVKPSSQCGQRAGSLRRRLVMWESPGILETTLFDPPFAAAENESQRGGNVSWLGNPWSVDGRVGTRAQAP